MYKLYGTTHTSTCAVKAALTEAGAPFEEVEITTRAKQHLMEEYRQINPRQQVPLRWSQKIGQVFKVYSAG